ncbi:helicase-related protein [Acinetobacter junii]|uniref:helicase-related protein n=1 Tax=Acinetobacter junii TaxID=40215 RepID=UPI000F672E88|nr:helicase-related protein [Acinetobacter junii]MDH1003673.1 helicase-related protein [Acinetobacter junii]MDH1376549.1 helicase-related protein [Acinetobacter junii]QXR27880.1 ATP-dependent helicase [Acinetobacter junii]
MKLIDNINNTLGNEIEGNLNSKSRLKIAASYFSIYAFAALKKELEKIEELQFIFTSPTFVADNVTDKLKKEKREFVIPQQDRESSLYGTEFEIHLRNKLSQKAIAKECADWIRRKAKFKSNNSNAPMQEFINIQKPEHSLTYMPIQGFTPMGLGFEKGNAISNIVNCFDETATVQTYIQLFNQIWNDASKVDDVTSEIIQHIESVYQENPPERIYFLMLYNIFKDFLEDLNEDVMPNDLTGYQDTLVWNKLFNFQKDAAVGIINKLESYNGCILADSVGLGKTFTALAVIKYYELRNKSVLVLCPKKLSANWTNYNANLVTNIFAKDRFNYDVLYHTDLSRKGGETLGIDLAKINWGNYDLVVIDESHNFRNRGTFKDRETRYDRLMNQVIRKGVKTKVLMLSATPVNNHFTDLKNQLALAYEGNAALLENKLDTERDIETIFRRAQASFNAWAKLDPAQRTTQAILNLLDFDFFKLLDSVTIARSRKHIQTFYDTKDIGQFPQRLKPISFRCALSTDQDSVSLNQIYADLSLIKMSVYAPVSYIFPSALKKYEEIFDTRVEGKGKLRQVDREKSLQALMTVNLLKRLESSVHAFRLTLNVLKKNIENVLAKIADFEARQADDEVSISPDFGYDEDENGELLNSEDLIGNKLKIHLADMDLLSWKTDLDGDYHIILGLLRTIQPITADKDAKLQHLKAHVVEKIQNPINANNRKVIIFTAFADTANYIYEHIAPILLETYGLHSAKVIGSDNTSTIKTRVGSRQSYDMQGLLTLFSPQSKQKADIFPEESREIDVLIATDCISEGQNLQDCDYLINFDIHWNPVRIIQRFGRVDRIGSSNSVIQLVNYWPDISLDEYINLRERVENRMVIVDMTSTGDDNVLSAQANDIAYRRKQLQKLQTEVLDLEDANTGVSITDLGLNDFRMDLLGYMEEHPELERLPNGLHTVVPAQPELGLNTGVIFTLRARHPESHTSQSNRLYPYYLIYINKNGEVVYDYTQAKYLLDIARKACRGKVDPIPEAYEKFNQETNDGRDMSQYSALLDTVIHSIQNIKVEKDIDSLFSGLTTSALVDVVSGLNDFELISFIVIEDTSS